MKHSIIALFILVSFVVFNCTRKSKKLLPIAGTPISISPPDGFTAATSINGFRHATKAATIIGMEIPATFKETIEDLAITKLKSLGVSLLGFDSIEVSGGNGIICSLSRLSHGQNMMQWMLILPYDGHAVTVTGSFLKTEENSLSSEIKKSILTVHLKDPSSKASPFNISIPEMKIAKVLPGPSVTYTPNGDWTQKTLLSMSFLVARSPRPDSVSIEEMSAYQFHEVCNSCSIEENTNAVAIDNMQGSELWGFTATEHKLKYQLILQDSIHTYLMVGTADTLQDEMLSLYKQAARTFKRNAKL